ncbi:MAG: serine/threonine-protein kinase [Planctomycetota bacterium]
MTGAGHGAVDDEPGRPADGDEPLAEVFREFGHLRADQLRDHLQAQPDEVSDDLLDCVSAMDFLDSVVGESTGALPEKLGDYRILGVLGRGGMGTVFEAFQESLERTVALKVLSPQLTNDPRMRRRFRTEARANATLHHQHIVPVFGFGEAQGYLYFAMERVDGISLDKHIAARKHRDEPVYESREAARRFAGVADALHHAHRRGVLHRDVKPGNVLVHPDGSLALADFGLSKIVGEHSASVSRSGGFLGTLQYAAPEQALGREQSEVSDLYSLGITMFECLTGRRPIEAESTEAVLHALTRGECPPLRRHLPRAPKDLEAVLGRLLSREPRDRYPNGEALARDLQRVADDEPVQVRRQSIFIRLWRRIRRAPGLSAAIAVAIILLFFSLDLLSQVRTDSDEQRYQAELTSIASEIAAGPGEAYGPSGLLGLLSGNFRVGERSDGPTRDVLQRLQAVEDDRRDDPRPALWWAALWPEVSQPASLLEGLAESGAVAVLSAIDVEIDQLQPNLAQLNQKAAFELYQLYFARAVLSLTEAIGDVQAAEKDLLRAQFLRPGAVAPQVLQALIDWDRSSALELTKAVETIVSRAGAVGSEVAGQLLGCLVGVGRPPAAMLMNFELDVPVAMDLSERLDRFGVLGTRAVGDVRGPLWRDLESRAESLAQSASSDTSVREQNRAAGLKILREQVGSRSILRAFELVFEWLGAADLGPGRTGPVVAGLSPRQELRGYELLATLLRGRSDALSDLESWINKAWIPRVGELDTLRIARLRARLSTEIALAVDLRPGRGQNRGGSFRSRRSVAVGHLDRWEELEPESAEIPFRRTLLALRSSAANGSVDDLEAAGVSAYTALQGAADPSSMKRQILDAIDEAEQAASRIPSVRDRFRRRSRQIRSYIESGF